MNQLINQSIKTMSSREIAELTGKEHKHVMRDCLNMFNELDLNHIGYAQNWTHPQNNQTYIEYALPRDLVETLITGYSIKLRHAVIARLRELEDHYKNNVVKLPDFTNPVEAARAWANEVEANQIAQEQLAIAAPKVEYFDRVADVHNYMNATTVGQKVGLSGTALNKQLEQFNVYNRSIKTGRVFQQWFIDQGFGVMKKTDNGYNQSRFTNKGEQWVIQKFISEGLV